MPTPEEQPIINSPYCEPVRHWLLDDAGRALPELLGGRRGSASRTMVPSAQQTGTQYELGPEGNEHAFINQVRDVVRQWRRDNYPGLSAVSRDLLSHWRATPEEHGPTQRLFFAQLEAMETLMWLYEAPRQTTNPFKRILDEKNRDHNNGCNRLAARMATGTGKTMVMAMMIAWHTVLFCRGNRQQKEKHAKTFVLITPGLTVKERLQELDPKKPGNIYEEQNLLPSKYARDIQQATIRIVNFQAFRQRELFEGDQDQKRMIALRKRRRGFPAEDKFEDYSSMLERVLNLPFGPGYRNVIVLNDEAHHCYGNAPIENGDESTQGEEKEIKRARQWFRILEELYKQERLLVVHDLSATPYYVSHQWLRFPWILSDYDLHEAMEAGLVKIPRVPVGDDTEAEEVILRDLYGNTRPKRLNRDAMHQPVDGAMRSLYRSYKNRADNWEEAGHEHPPVLIVVANSISNANALYDWIAGYENNDAWVPGAFDLLSNVDATGGRKNNPVTIIVHSEKLEEGGTSRLTDRMCLLAKEIAEVRGEEDHARTKDQQAEYLRRILATVGKENQPGEHIRCVVSVGMLTEGWDAHTVTHILGYRAFQSSLLCEQVAGRALRRVNYQSMQDFEGEKVLKAEYSEIIGIPFHFCDVDGLPPEPPDKAIEVRTQPSHEEYRIQWSQVETYQHKIQPGRIRLNSSKVKDFDAMGTYNQPTETELAGVFGELEKLDSPRERQQRVHYEFARYALQKLQKDDVADSDIPPNLHRFAQLLCAVRDWVAHPKVKTCEPWWQLIAPSVVERALKSFLEACDIDNDKLKVAVVLAEPPVLDTRNIRFTTSISGEMPGKDGPAAYPARERTDIPRPTNKRSELNVAVCDSPLEWRIAEILDSDALEGVVLAWTRNLRLKWTIPWLDETKGEWHNYIPDFVVRLTDDPGTGQKRHVVLEGKGNMDEHWDEKRRMVLDYWLPGVNDSTDDACDGKWVLLEVRHDRSAIQQAGDLRWTCRENELEERLQRLTEDEDAWN